MISLKNLLTEDIKFVLKKSPTAVLSKAADLLAGVFRIKLVGKKDDKPIPIQDVIAVLNSPKNTQFGPTSPYGNGEWYFIISDDLKKSSKKLVNDILVYPKTKKVAVGRGETIYENVEDLFKPGTTPKEVGMVGRSIITTVSDFVEAIDPAVERKYQLKASPNPIDLGNGAKLISQIKEVLFNTVADSPSSDEKEIVVKSDGDIDSSAETDIISNETKFKPGDTFVNAGETRITLFKLKDTFDPKTDIKTTTSSNNVTYDEINGLFSNSRYVDSTPEWVQFENEMFRSLAEFKYIDETTPLNTKYTGFTPWRRITKEQYDLLVKQLNDKQPITTNLETFFKDNANNAQTIDKTTGSVVLTYTSNYDDDKTPGIKKEQKITKQELIDNRTKTDNKWIAEAFQQLIMQKVVPVAKFKEISPAVVAFSKLRKPVDGNWGNYSKNVIYELNQAYGLGDTDEILPQLIEKLTAPLKTESAFSLKSILLEIMINEQDLSGLNPAAVKPRNVVSTTQTKKEPAKTATQTKKEPAKTATQTKKEPAKTTTQTKKEPVKTATNKPYRRGIDVIAETWNQELKWSSKLKVWYFDTMIEVIQGPLMADATMTMHVRDDGSIAIWRKGSGLWLQGVNSGWSDGGRKLVVKEVKWNSTHTYTSKLPAGQAFLDVIGQAVEHALGAWSEYFQRVGIYRSNGIGIQYFK